MYVSSRCRCPALDPILNDSSPPQKRVRNRHDKFAKENNVQDSAAISDYSSRSEVNVRGHRGPSPCTNASGVPVQVWVIYVREVVTRRIASRSTDGKQATAMAPRSQCFFLCCRETGPSGIRIAHIELASVVATVVQTSYTLAAHAGTRKGHDGVRVET
jgi:hypothetical protein